MRWLEKRLPPVIVVALFGVLSWAIARRWPGPGWSESVGWWISVALGSVGVMVVVAGIIAFRRAGTTVDPTRPEAASALVVSGIFRYTRNPMYLGFAVLLTAWAVKQASLWALLAVPLCVLYLDRFQIRPEERALRRRFAAQFDAYCRRVRRWF